MDEKYQQLFQSVVSPRASLSKTFSILSIELAKGQVYRIFYIERLTTACLRIGLWVSYKDKIELNI